MLRVSKEGLDFIKRHEALRLCPYLDATGTPTIGYGNTFYTDGTRVTMSDECLSEKKANKLFLDVLKGLEGFVSQKVVKSVTQAQFDALVSFCYNVGKGAFGGSTLLKKVNANPLDENIAYQFSRWNRSKGKVLGGLIKRRKEEAERYFLTY